VQSAVLRTPQRIPDDEADAHYAAGERSPVTVLHIDTERGWRGGERQVLWLAESLVRSGNRCIIAARPDGPLGIRAARLGLQVFPCSPISELDPVAVIRLRRLVRREGVQIVHAHTAHAAALAVACAGNAQTVITRRVDFPIKRGWFSQLKYKRAAAVIAISDAVCRVLVASGVDAGKIEIIPSGIDLHRRVDRADRRSLQSLGVPESAPLVVMIAALVNHKDPLTFVSAMKDVVGAVPAAHAIIVGEGPLRPALEQRISELGLAQKVHMVGFREDADSILAAADAVALSSREEGLGTVLIDALWMGKPVAATCAGGIPEIIQNGSSGLLVPIENGTELGRAISRLLTDEVLRSRLALGGRARATTFSVERTAAETSRVYDRVLATARMREKSSRTANSLFQKTLGELN
jgi:glycosyltransferase involved in cell wall biosynthesis